MNQIELTGNILVHAFKRIIARSSKKSANSLNAAIADSSELGNCFAMMREILLANTAKKSRSSQLNQRQFAISLRCRRIAQRNSSYFQENKRNIRILFSFRQTFYFEVQLQQDLRNSINATQNRINLEEISNYFSYSWLGYLNKLITS